jgi:predicted enzyme related to lactoylglutathione lyase
MPTMWTGRRGSTRPCFGWKIEAWGPPGFYMIRTGSDGDPGIHGSLQQRREAVNGKGMIGYECTIGVDSVEDVAEAIEKNGGRVVMGKMHIPTVGWRCAVDRDPVVLLVEAALAIGSPNVRDAAVSLRLCA